MRPLVAGLAGLGLAAAVAHFLVHPYNPGFAEHPAITRAHVVLGGFYLAAAPLQLVGRIRARALGYHRWAGRLLVATGVVVGLSALFLGLVVPFSGDAERVVIGLFGGLFLLSLTLGFVRVRQGRIAAHREWMLRAFTIGLSVATMRVLFIPALILAGDPTHRETALLSVGSFTAAFLLHTAVAERWIRRTRSQTAGRRRRTVAPDPSLQPSTQGAHR